VKGVVAFPIADKRNPEAPKSWAPVHSWRSHQGKVKGRSQRSVSPFGFRRLSSQGGSHLESRSHETRSILSGEGCGHISDHVGESWCFVLAHTDVTHKDLWIHTSVWEIFYGEIEESIRLKEKIKNDPKTRRSREPVEVGVLRQSGIRAYNNIFL
jgi:hypothetical protein